MRVLLWSWVLWFACSAPAAVVVPVTPVEPMQPVAVPVADPDPAPPALRMPGDVKPLRYALELTVVPSAPTSTGKITIAAEVVRPTRVVWLNATDVEITSATLAGAKARVVKGNADFFGLSVDRELAPGPLPIELQFTSKIDKVASRGIYSAKEPGEGADNEYAYTFFEPVDARRAFPCFDEPGAKVPWQVTFHIKANHVALGNAPVVKETAEDGGMKRVELAETPPLPSYLVAFIVGPFELVDGGSAGRVPTPIRFAIPKGRSGELGYAKRVTPKVVKALEDYFAMDYPFKKLDVAVVPRYWGTMEHPGIVAMGQELTLIRPAEEVRARTYEYANILAHELGHYWFGDYVTMAWWDDTWLNEALEQWQDLNTTDAAEPTFKALDRRIDFASYAMTADETLSTRAMRQPVTTRDGIEGSFDGAVTYSKGASVFRMFEMAVGREKWRSAIQAYLKAHAWGTATSDDLLASLRASLGAPTEAALRTFLDQPGVPRITTELVCAKGAAPTLQIAQSRALPAGTVDPRPRTWSIPVCVRFGGATAKQACTRLDGATGTLALGKVGDACPAWVLPNANAYGYYRSVLTPAQAKALLVPAPGKPTPLTAAERMMIAVDLEAMSHRDELSIDAVLGLVPMVTSDPDARVQSRGVDLAAFDRDALDPDGLLRAKRYQLKTFGALAQQLGWVRAKTDSQERHDLRAAVLRRVGADDPAIVKTATALAAKWLADRTGLDDELVETALRIAATHGDQAWFTRVVTAAKTARDRKELSRILAPLGAARDPKVLQQAFALVQGTELDLRDSVGILYTAFTELDTRPNARAFATQHLDEVLGRMRDDEAGWLLAYIARTACTPAALTAMTALVAPRSHAYRGAEIPVARGLEQSAQCIAKTQRQKSALTKFLAAY